jgi:AcrR family transcriptional regulator
MRSDARQNRDSLLAAAVAAFTLDANASLEGIARDAGVGIGTLYRHYPTRDALVAAAYRSEIEKLCAVAPALHAKHPPDVALARFLDRFIEQMLSNRGMIQAMRAVVAAANGEPMNESLAMIEAAIGPIVEAGRVGGQLREDVTVNDFIAAKGAIATSRPENARRLATILVDGLRAQRTVARAGTERFTEIRSRKTAKVTGIMRRPSARTPKENTRPLQRRADSKR